MHYLKNSLMLAAFMMPLSMLTAPLPKPADKGDKAGDIPASNSEAYQMPVYVQESDFQLPDHRGAYVDYPDGTSKWISLQDPHFRSHILGVIQDDAKRVQALIVQEMKHRDEVPGITSASMSQPSMPNTGYIIPLRTPERTPRGEFYALTAAWPEELRDYARGHYEQRDSHSDMTIDDARQMADSYKDQVAALQTQITAQQKDNQNMNQDQKN